MNRNLLISLSVLILATLACSAVSTGTNTVIGSGHIISEARTLGSFTSVELRGSSDVDIVVGATQSVTVKSDDNIVPLIETTVSDGKLIISTKPFTSMTTTSGVHISIVVPSLQNVVLSGSGNMRVTGVNGPALGIEMPGSGNITVAGTTDRATITMAGSGNILCSDLKAHSATVMLTGSGTVKVYADKSLNANISGSGAIRYSGSPSQLNTNITGSGTISQ